MDLRSTIHSRPGVTIGICIAVLLVVGYFMVRGTTGVGSHHAGSGLAGNYYTADEGQTWSPDVWSQVSPFEKDGKTWVRAYVYTCDGGKPFVGYLEKYSPEAQADINAQEEQRMKNVRIGEWGDHGLMVKRIGTGDWVAKDTAEGATIVKVECPNGGTLKPIIPELPLP